MRVDGNAAIVCGAEIDVMTDGPCGSCADGNGDVFAAAACALPMRPTEPVTSSRLRSSTVTRASRRSRSEDSVRTEFDEPFGVLLDFLAARGELGGWRVRVEHARDTARTGVGLDCQNCEQERAGCGGAPGAEPHQPAHIELFVLLAEHCPGQSLPPGLRTLGAFLAGTIMRRTGTGVAELRLRGKSAWKW